MPKRRLRNMTRQNHLRRRESMNEWGGRKNIHSVVMLRTNSNESVLRLQAFVLQLTISHY